MQVSERAAITQLTEQNLDLFSDVPKCTNMLNHDTDVGEATPTKQHPYRTNPIKRQLLRKEVTYMLENGIVEPSSRAWSSICLLTAKSDGSPWFCTDFHKVHAVTKPDSLFLIWMFVQQCL